MYQHRQIHVWISESDYRLLREEATVTRESVSAMIRRLIKHERQRLKQPGPYTSDQSECGRLFSTIQP
jgi:predicted CopG family antitoxin